MEKLTMLNHWKSERDDAGIIWLTFDKQNSSTNTISTEVLEELSFLLQSYQADPLPSGLVIQSGKKNGFIAGADIQQFKNLETPEAAFTMIRQGQMVFNQLASLRFPTVAFIQGFCLGGGLELSLACRYRVAVIENISLKGYKTKLGLPEVLLGIHPGWGGTVRLPRLIGAVKAMDLILSGRTLSAKAALKMGVVDMAVPERQGLAAVRFCIQKQPKQKQASFVERLANVNFVRPVLGKWLRKKVAEKVNRTYYPAPFSMIDLWVAQGVQNDAAFMAEAKSISQLMMTDTARHLVQVFRLQEKLKNTNRGFQFNVTHVHVIGAGVMGGDIAAWCALKGLRVTLQDQNEKAIANALNRALVLFKKQLKEPFQIKSAQDRLMPDKQGEGIKNADLIIEAIIEKKEAKIELFKILEKTARPDAIFATNTSTIPLNEIYGTLDSKARLIGLHFFNPVSKMPLIEVVVSEAVDPLIVQKGIAFVRAIEKLPLSVKSSPGFLVNRVLMPYLLESMLLLDEGVPAAAIDHAAIEFGMPMGPIELADTVGLDVCLYAVESLSQYFEESIPASCRQLVQQGHLGKKTGQGFYQYKNGKPIKKKTTHYRVPEDIIDRLILRMLNEAVACLRENLVADSDYLDAGMIFGAGFPPFRGGPMAYVREQGEALLLQRLNLLAQRYGKRFAADEGWHHLLTS